ncbi:MAG: TrmH family RNA methyltransferase [Nocardioidaceae bacterium]
MARLIDLGDATDERLADYRDLRDVQLRTSLEAEHGLFIAEGEKVVRRAVVAGHEPRSFLMARRWLDGLGDVLDRWPQTPCYVVSEHVAEQVTGFHVHRGALASLHRRPLPGVHDVLASAGRVVVLEDVVDHANVGAIIRSAAALGFDGALLSPRCADPLYRRSVKVSMGTVFALPYARLDDWYAAVAMLRSLGFVTVALTPSAGAVPLDQELSETLAVRPRLALLVGSEGPGLSRRWTSEADERVAIPMHAGVDSLNVAAATAVACWSLRRSRPR